MTIIRIRKNSPTFFVEEIALLILLKYLHDNSGFHILPVASAGKQTGVNLSCDEAVCIRDRQKLI
jgi:hypothetical protein